ncbi:bifunctional precorrin-2 dehydrogenase/sirohydrochlorin ferrochelatase [Deferribacteres bacterium DY0037]
MITRYPILMKMQGKQLLFVGGGAVAERKINSLLACDPVITVLSPEITEKLQSLAQLGVIKWTTELPTETFDYVFIATNEREINKEVYEFYKGKALINIADDPEACDFHLPATIIHGDVVISISTDGTDPSKSKRIREKLEEWISQGGLEQ